MKNVVEEIVRREYERLRPSIEQFCGCDLCRDDVLVYALNRMPPHYTSQLKGEVLTNVALEGYQERTHVQVILLDAFRRVAAEPREGHPPRA